MDFVAIDVETANADVGSICQVGMAHFVDGQIVDEWSTLVDPEDYFDGMNVSIHGIEPHMVRGSRPSQLLPTVSVRSSKRRWLSAIPTLIESPSPALSPSTTSNLFQQLGWIRPELCVAHGRTWHGQGTGWPWCARGLATSSSTTMLLKMRRRRDMFCLLRCKSQGRTWSGGNVESTDPSTPSWRRMAQPYIAMETPKVTSMGRSLCSLVRSNFLGATLPTWPQVLVVKWTQT